MGKDYYIQSAGIDVPVVSLDVIRRKHKLSPTDKSANGHGGYANHSSVNADVKSLPTYLGNLGYRVGLAGKWHGDSALVTLSLILLIVRSLFSTHLFTSVKVIKRTNSLVDFPSPSAAVQTNANFSFVVMTGLSSASRKPGCSQKLCDSVRNS